MNSEFVPDYHNILQVLHNQKPDRLPLYEHHIEVPFISQVLNEDLVLQSNQPKDLESYYGKICQFWKDMTYDVIDFEAPVCECYPGHGAIMGGMLGPIQTRKDFEKYPFDEIPQIFWERYESHFEALKKVLPPGMKLFGGCGYGVFESAQDLVGYEYLCIMLFQDPELFRDLFNKIGDLYITLWSKVIEKYSDLFAFFRMGDDLGFKTSTLMSPETYSQHLFPQYKRIIDLIHNNGKRFLLHCCGNIFTIMDDLIELGIDAKHSNEDDIAPFMKWIDLYSERIGLFGGIDVNTLCLNSYDDVYRFVLENGTEYRRNAKGYGLGSGNSIAGYVSVEGYMAMIDAAKEIWKNDKAF